MKARIMGVNSFLIEPENDAEVAIFGLWSLRLVERGRVTVSPIYKEDEDGKFRVYFLPEGFVDE